MRGRWHDLGNLTCQGKMSTKSVSSSKVEIVKILVFSDLCVFRVSQFYSYDLLTAVSVGDRFTTEIELVKK